MVDGFREHPYVQEQITRAVDFEYSQDQKRLKDLALSAANEGETEQQYQYELQMQSPPERRGWYGDLVAKKTAEAEAKLANPREGR